MRGIYVIESEGRVLYVGQSENIQERARTHFRKIQNELQPKSKMYWILWQLRKCGLNLKCWLLEETYKAQSLKGIEDENIRQLRPVLNTQVPHDMVSYINKIQTAEEALIMANNNGQWNFTNLKLLWEIKGTKLYFTDKDEQPRVFFKKEKQDKNFYIYGIFILEQLVYIGGTQGDIFLQIREIEANGYKGETNLLYLALKQNKNNYEFKILWQGLQEEEMVEKLNILRNILSPKY